jgi:hypothetical protein
MSEEMTNWKTLHKKESWGTKNFGIELRVAVDRELNENDARATYKIMDEIEDVIMRETVRTDSEEIVERAEERLKLLACFPVTEKIFIEEIPNGYCSRWCCEMRPWYKVTTSHGIITLGWRKRVIELSWEPRVTNGVTADGLFPAEDVTKVAYTIHAWGYEKAKQYISRLLA